MVQSLVFCNLLSQVGGVVAPAILEGLLGLDAGTEIENKLSSFCREHGSVVSSHAGGGTGSGGGGTDTSGTTERHAPSNTKVSSKASIFSELVIEHLRGVGLDLLELVVELAVRRITSVDLRDIVLSGGQLALQDAHL